MRSNYVQLLRDLNNLPLHVKDEEQVNDIISDMVTCGKDKIQIISDFDWTLTKPNKHGRVSGSSIDVLHYCPSATERYVKTFKEFKIGLENFWENSRLQNEQTLGELWENLQEALRGEPISYEELLDTIAKSGPPLRVGTEQLLSDLHKANIPILLFSAGYGSVIECILKDVNILYPNVKILSNFFRFDNGTIQGFENTYYINTRNKTNLKSYDIAYHDSVKDRDNVIVLGDSLDDAHMADGIDSKRVLKIALKCSYDKKKISDFLEAFDIVIEDNNTINLMRSVLKCML